MFRSLVSLLLVLTGLRAAEIPEGGPEMLPGEWQQNSRFQASKERATGERLDFGSGRKGWRLQVSDDKATQFQIQLARVLTGEVKSGEKCLLTFDARCLPDSSTDGKGRILTVVEIKEPPDYEKLGQDSQEIGGEWETVYMPFPAKQDSKPGITWASIMAGGRKQTLESANMRLLNFGAENAALLEVLATASCPGISWPGRPRKGGACGTAGSRVN